MNKISDKVLLYSIMAIAFVALIMFIFYPTVFYILIATAAFLGIVYLCVKYKWARIATAIVGAIVLTAGSIYSSYNIYQYYTAESGEFGQIEDFFNTNEVNFMDGLKINFSNVELKATGNKDEYSAKITKNQQLKLDEERDYWVYVDGIPCSSVEITPYYIVADFRMSFENMNLESMKTDVLQLRFSLASKSTEFNITTKGGTDAVKYWNSFFMKNGFVVSIEEGSRGINDDSFEHVEGKHDYAEIFVLKATSYVSTVDGYIVSCDYEITNHFFMKIGTVLKIPNRTEQRGQSTVGWVKDKQKILEGIGEYIDVLVEKDMSLYYMPYDLRVVF